MAGGKLYLLGNKGLENEFVQALAVEDGKAIWTTRIGNVGNPKQNPSYPAASSTPTIDGEWLFALSSDGEIAALEQAQADAPAQPYRQGIYLLTRVDGKIVNRTYRIRDAAKLVGAHADPKLLKQITADQLTPVEGCEVTFTKAGR